MANQDTAVWWIKRDFRLFDNTALHEAIKSDQVIPLFVVEPEVWDGPDASVFHRKAQAQALQNLRVQLQKRNADLLVKTGRITSVLKEIKDTYSFHKLVSYQEIGLNHTFTRDRQVGLWCRRNNITWKQKRFQGVVRGLKDRDNRLQKFNDFIDKPLRPIPDTISTPANLFSGWPKEIKNSLQKKPQMQEVTRSAGAEILASFLANRGLNYSGNISSMNTAPEFASRLSVHLAWGTLSLREVFRQTRKRKGQLKDSDKPKAGKWRRSLSSFESRLYWHSHFMQKLEDEPQMEFAPQNPAFASIEWENDREKLRAWTHGNTGVPMVDAAVRCFRETGYLNFRSRAMITSFACHALHLHWRKVLYPLAAMMADYVPGIHVPQLQMQAGVTGINTIRNYNPNKQMKDHDPQTRFIKEWCPKLSEYSPEEIHAHGTGESTLDNYRNPIVDEKERRKDMVGRLYEVKNSDEAKRYADDVYNKHGSRK